MSALSRLFVLTAALMSVTLTSALAGGSPYYYPDAPGANLPACDAPSVQSAVRRTIARADFSYREGLVIDEMDLIDQTSVSQYAPSPVARRYCRARAYLSNGRTHPVYYMIEEHAGFVGLSWNVEACLPGHDRWHVHDGWCRTVRR